MNKKIKYNSFILSSGTLMLIGFIAGIIFSLFPFMKTLGPNPNRLIVIFVTIPTMLITGAIISYLGMGIAFLLWKPFLSPHEVKKFIFEPHTPKEEIPRIINMLFVNPYYKLANLIYPEIKKRK